MSRLSNFVVENFMSIEKAKIDFDENNIINIKGYNDSGKSAILRALRVAMVDAYSTKQKKFIKNGKNFFRITLNFDDGVKIVREKLMNGSSVWEMYLNGEQVYSSKVGTTNTKVRGVPDEIRKYLNLTSTKEGEYLNFQSIYDKQFLIETSGSENLELLNGVLKLKETTIAQKAIKHDLNMIVTNINSSKANIDYLTGVLDPLKPVTDDLISAVEASVIQEELSLQQFKLLENSEKSSKDIQTHSSSYLTLDELDPKNLIHLSSILGTADKFRSSQTSLNPELKEIQTSRLESLNKIGRSVVLLQKSDVPALTLEVVDSYRLSSFKNLGKSVKNLSESLSDLLSLEEEKTRLSANLKSLEEEAIQSGMSYVECGHCGEYVMVGDKAHAV